MWWILWRGAQTMSPFEIEAAVYPAHLTIQVPTLHSTPELRTLLTDHRCFGLLAGGSGLSLESPVQRLVRNQDTKAFFFHCVNTLGTLQSVSRGVWIGFQEHLLYADLYHRV